MTNTCRMRIARRLALPVLLLLTACGGEREAGGGGEAEPAGNHPTYGGGPPGGVLVALSEREPDDLNPLTFDTNPAYQAVHLMFRALARRDTTLSNYQPDLAERWELRPDSTLVLNLRRGVRWHDGQPVTAHDVVFTIERQKDRATASPRQADVAAVESATAADSFTVHLKLNRTGTYTVNSILEVVTVPRHLLQGVAPAETRRSGFGQQPVGNGFYRFVRWDRGQQLVLEVNPEVPEGRAALDRVLMRFVPDMNTAITELLAGQGDLMARVPPDQRERISASSTAKLYSGPRVRPMWIAWNTRMPPLDDVRVRRALAMAIDRPTLARGLFGEVGEPALSPIPPALKEHSRAARPLPFDPQAARQLLAQAGWTDSNGDGLLDKGGRPLRIELDYISTDQVRQDLAVAAQSMLRRVGVELVPRPYESTAWVDRLRARQFQGSLWGWGWGPGVVGPNAEMVFHSRSIPPNGPNFAGYSSPRADALIDSTLVVQDPAQLQRVWAALEQQLIDDVPYLPLVLDPELFGVHQRFANVSFRGIEWWEDVPYWHIPAERRLPRDRAR